MYWTVAIQIPEGSGFILFTIPPRLALRPIWRPIHRTPGRKAEQLDV
jgi:hypothetical protein